MPQNLRGAFLIKTETGYQLVTGLGPAPVSSAGTPAGIRFVQPGTPTAVGQGIRAVSTPSIVTLPVSSTVRPPNQVTQPLTIQTSQANSNAAAAPSQMSPNTAKKKCKNFLSTLIRLASDQPEQVATNVKNLIQGLIVRRTRSNFVSTRSDQIFSCSVLRTV